MQAVLSRLPTILVTYMSTYFFQCRHFLTFDSCVTIQPKPPRGNHPKVPIPSFHSGPSNSREFRPLMPASFVNSFPEENYVPIYSSRSSPAIENSSEQMVKFVPSILSSHVISVGEIYILNFRFTLPLMQSFRLNTRKQIMRIFTPWMHLITFRVKQPF